MYDKAGLIRRETATVKISSLFVGQNVVAFTSACNISTLSRAQSQSIEQHPPGNCHHHAQLPHIGHTCPGVTAAWEHMRGVIMRNLDGLAEGAERQSMPQTYLALAVLESSGLSGSLLTRGKCCSDSTSSQRAKTAQKSSSFAGRTLEYFTLPNL